MLLTFQKTDHVAMNTQKVNEDFFLMFVMGVIKQNLNGLPDEIRNLWDVHYEWGGAGYSWVDLYPVENPDSTLCWGMAGGFGYAVYSSGANGEVEWGNGLDNENPTIDEICDFIKDEIQKLIVQGEIYKEPVFKDLKCAPKKKKQKQ